MQPRRFRLHNANADGSLLANLLSLAAEFVRTGEQSVEPIAMNHAVRHFTGTHALSAAKLTFPTARPQKCVPDTSSG